MREHGKGHAVHIPWHIDWQYYRDGLPVHQEIIAAAEKIFDAHHVGGEIRFDYETKIYVGRFRK